MLKPYSSDHREAILALNHQSVAVLSPMDAERFEHLKSMASVLEVAEDNGDVAGFLMAFRDGTDYDSINYRWFSENYSGFLYIDRVVVSGLHRGKGIASTFYDHAIDWGRRQGLTSLVAEIDIEPPNEPSLKFHKRYGFTEVDRLVHSPEKIVSLQHLPLS